MLKNRKRLQLNREAIRVLAGDELGLVGGGEPKKDTYWDCPTLGPSCASSCNIGQC